MQKTKKKIPAMMLVLALFLAGCNAVFPTAQVPDPNSGLSENANTQSGGTAPDADESAPMADDSAKDTSTGGADETMAESDPVATSGSDTPAPATDVPAPPTEAPAEEAAAPPLGRPDLRATSPSSVDVASGQVQLIEFFAFW